MDNSPYCWRGLQRKGPGKKYNQQRKLQKSNSRNNSLSASVISRLDFALENRGCSRVNL